MSPMTEQMKVITSGQQAVPLLRAGGVGYALWKPEMIVFLQRSGAETAHTRPITEVEWKNMNTQVGQWRSDELTDALALLSGGDSSSGVKLGDEEQQLALRKKEARKLITQTVERSQRIYGLIYSALPADLRAQSAELSQGWAYGLWRWLETKFQSTEEDFVGELFSQWSSLRQGDVESFDAYRARVNGVKESLKAAKEEPSVRMYAYTLLDRLQPRYKQAVLALKAGGQLKDAQAIDWEAVTGLINAHERREIRLDEETEDGSLNSGQAMAASAIRHGQSTKKQQGASYQQREGVGQQERSSSSSYEKRQADSQRWLANIQCFKCLKFGHTKQYCTNQKAKQGQQGEDRYRNQEGSGAGYKEQVALVRSIDTHNQYDSLSESESEKNEDDGKMPKYITYAAIVISGLDRDGRPITNMKHELVMGAETPASTRVGGDSRVSSSSKGTIRAPAAAASVGSSTNNTNRSEKDRSKSPSRVASSSSTSASEEDTSAVNRYAKPLREREPVSVSAKSRKPVGVGLSPDKALANSSWGVDTMASVHISGNKDLFTSLRRCAPLQVLVADGGSVTVTQFGSVNIRVNVANGRTIKIPIECVYYHERFSANLLSWGVLKEASWELNSTKAETYLITPGKNRLTLSMRGRVSVLHTADQERVYAMEELNSMNVDALVRLHEKLGHATFSRMIKIIKGGSTVDVTKVQATAHELREAEQRISQCKACIQGKGKKSSFGHRGLDIGTEPGECLHMDTYGVRIERDGKQWLEYGTTVTCAYSGYRWFVHSYTKDKIPYHMVDTLNHVRNQLGRNVKRIHTDGGTEFINRTMQEYCRMHGIHMSHSAPGTPELNGVAERTVGSNKDTTRTMIFHSGIPLRFWGRAACHATFIWNRVHVSSRTKVTPYESVHKKPPSAKHWGVFGCNAYYHIPKEQRSAMQPKAEPCIYLGHDDRLNCATIYSLKRRKEIRTRDVTYFNGDFSFCAAILKGDSAIDAIIEQNVQVDITQSMDDVENADSELNDDSSRMNVNSTQGGNSISGSRNNSSSNSTNIVSNDLSDDEEEEEQQFVIEAITGERKLRGVRQYRCKWEGYDEETWQSAANIEEDVPELVREFHATKKNHSQQSSSSKLLTNVSLKDLNIENNEDAVEPQVHMAMSAMMTMEPQSGSMSEAEYHAMVCAVKSGIARLEAETPKTYKQAMLSVDVEKWIAASNKEWNSLLDKEVFELVNRNDVPDGINVISNKWVFKKKVDETGSVEEFKARLTPRGFEQKENKDYFETFARTGEYKTMRLGLSLTAKFDYELNQLDVPTAFLNADLEEDVYMELPEGYRQGKENMVCKLKKSLYGLKQSPRNWYLLISKFITDNMKFKSTVSDPCLFFKRSQTGRLILMFVFVDDFKIAYHHEDQDEWFQLRQLLVDRFQTKDKGECTWILGMKITRNRKEKTIKLDQEVYINKMLEKFDFNNCRTVATPEIVGASQQELTEQQSQSANRQRYMEMTGSLMYAAISTRPDIAHAVFYLASNMLAPLEIHMQAAVRVMRYLADTRDLGLMFGTRNGGIIGDSRGHSRTLVDVCAFADADWANDKGDRRSITGWVSKLNGDPISWSSKKQRTVALSTCEAELYAEAAAIQEVLWLNGILKELGLKSQVGGSTIYGDNQAAISISKNGIKGDRTKHVDVKYHFITESIERNEIKLKWIPTQEQQADIFTKALPVQTFELLRKELMSG